MVRKQPDRQSEGLLELFRQHLKEQHNIVTDEPLSAEMLLAHMQGKHVFIPVSIFSNTNLSCLESAVKFLRENEGMSNAQAAKLLGRQATAAWITYRNAKKKHAKQFIPAKPDLMIPTEALSSGLSALESISFYLNQKYSMGYSRIAQLLGRDPRTIWTVCNRARKKLAR
jgi:predicted DNA-binding protein (UPF0251 family)